MLTSEDWRSASADEILPLYLAEARRWSVDLDWDSASNWEEVERGREGRVLPGVLVRDTSGQIVAWSFYLIHNRALQIGGFVSSSEESTNLMLDVILTPETRSAVDTVTFFAFADAPDLAPALRRRGLAVDRYWYLKRHTPQGVQPALVLARKWRTDDLLATAELLSRAYESPNESRPFAPRGTPEEWLDYVTQLTTGSGCGALLLDACVAIPVNSARLAGVALVTRISPDTGHIAQLVVDPGVRRRGIGLGLVEAACGAAARVGCARMTLLVGGRNREARLLYEGARFESTLSFVSAGSLQPTRTSAPAGAAGSR